MNTDNRATKLYLRSLAPNEALSLIDKYNIPSPWNEVLKTACAHRKTGFLGCDYLAKHYKIHLSYWDFVRKLKESLPMFRKSHFKNKNIRINL